MSNTPTNEDKSVEICYECYYFREYAPNGVRSGHYLCVNPQSFRCDKEGVGKATRACQFAKPRNWLPPSITK